MIPCEKQHCFGQEFAEFFQSGAEGVGFLQPHPLSQLSDLLGQAFFPVAGVHLRGVSAAYAAADVDLSYPAVFTTSSVIKDLRSTLFPRHFRFPTM